MCSKYLAKIKTLHICLLLLWLHNLTALRLKSGLYISTLQKQRQFKLQLWRQYLCRYIIYASTQLLPGHPGIDRQNYLYFQLSCLPMVVIQALPNSIIPIFALFDIYWFPGAGSSRVYIVRHFLLPKVTGFKNFQLIAVFIGQIYRSYS